MSCHYKVLLCHHIQMQDNKNDCKFSMKIDCYSQAESPTQISDQNHHLCQFAVHYHIFAIAIKINKICMVIGT